MLAHDPMIGGSWEREPRRPAQPLAVALAAAIKF